ncbi:MAG: sigma-70 family RNA polymerase sigma factor [Deltaproteobacteria bacterium]|jgi:RNA polymerase sigma-70 factor (ECF subfamily)|nr:sigma-70 family RNA polymerase sigma factor [Deltaproteobacteria bacterium]
MNGGTKRPVTSSGEDALLIKAFQRGDKRAFDQLVIRHKDRIFNLCYRFIGDYEEANDSAQEAFVKAYGSLKTFRLESAFSTWLYRIAVNTCKNKLGSSSYRAKRKTVSLDNPGNNEVGALPMEIQNGTPSPLARMEEKERRRLVQTALDALPAEFKMVVALRDIEGLSYEEIAQVTGLNLGTVKSRIARARTDLRNKLRGVL